MGGDRPAHPLTPSPLFSTLPRPSVCRKTQVCVRRRAVISVMSNVACADSAEAKAAVDDIFDRCYSDKEPFGAIP